MEERCFQNANYHFTDKHIRQVESQNSTFLFSCHLWGQKPLQIMKDVSARTYGMNYSTTDSEKLVIPKKAS